MFLHLSFQSSLCSFQHHNGLVAFIRFQVNMGCSGQQNYAERSHLMLAGYVTCRQLRSLWRGPCREQAMQARFTLGKTCLVLPGFASATY